MTKVAFWYDYGIEYSGGLNYFRNLLYAVSLVGRKDVVPYVFFGHDVDARIIQEFSLYANVVQTRVLTRKTFPWFIHRCLYRSFGLQWMVNAVLKRHAIAVVSHPSMVAGKRRPYRLVTWIADFQYLHLPELFPGLDVGRKSAQLNRVIGESDAVVLSSYDACRDFNSIVEPGYAAKARVLQFVSQPGSGQEDGPARTALEHKFGFSGRYFFLPNQFWQHKNHKVVFDAVRLLKEQGQDILVLCTGWLHDPRLGKSGYVSDLCRFIEQHGLAGHIRLLGSIEYAEVLALFRHSVAVLNPSLFEGWSSSVEEAKSMGQRIVLSNIGVHLEQAPAGGVYFDPADAGQLAAILSEAWSNWPDGIDPAMAQAACDQLRARTEQFGRRYLDIIDELGATT